MRKPITIKIGRMPENDCVIEEKLAEDLHAIIVFHYNGDIWIEDQGSRFGTLVNKESVTKKLLSRGDLVQIGFTQILWEKFIPEELTLDPIQKKDDEIISAKKTEDLNAETTSGLNKQIASPQNFNQKP